MRLLQEQAPMSVRQVFYQATVHGLVDKTEKGYGRVQRMLSMMRKAGTLPYDWITDNTRVAYRSDTFDSPADAIRATARFYRKALWTNAESRVEIWCEKDALTGVIWPTCQDYDVPLYVCRGFASLSFIYSAAMRNLWA